MKHVIRLVLCLLVTAGAARAADPPGTPNARDGTDPPAPGVTDHARDGDHDEDFARQRFYLGLGPLFALERFETSSHRFTGGTGANVDADDSYGADARFGFRIHPNVALEAQGQYYGHAKLGATGPGPIGEREVGHFEGASGTANFKIYPLVGRVQPYLLGGFGFLWARLKNDVPGSKHGNDTEIAGRGGVGVDVYLDENFALDLEGSYLQPASNLKNFPLAAVTGGIQYHF